MDEGGSAPAGIDPRVPNVARIYDYLLDGKDNYAADREAAERLLKVAPETRITVRANRAFLRRAVRRLAESGIRQFVDLGAGLPTQSNVHEVAHTVAPDARVVYADIDPVVVTHGRALLASSSNVTVVQGDVREPEPIFEAASEGGLIDFDRPVAVLLLAVLHFIQDSDDPAGIVRRIHGALAPGSVLVLSHICHDGGRPDAIATAEDIYKESTASVALRHRSEIEALFDGFTLEEPGLVYATQWWPDGEDPEWIEPAGTFLLAGVARR